MTTKSIEKLIEKHCAYRNSFELSGTYINGTAEYWSKHQRKFVMAPEMKASVKSHLKSTANSIKQFVLEK